MFPQTQLLSNLRQGLAVDERRPQPGQSPLVGIGMRVVQQSRDAAIENGIAEELEALIVIRAGAPVGQCRMAQRRLHERIAERTFHPAQDSVGHMLGNHCTFTVLSKCTDSDTF